MDSYSYISENGNIRQIIDLVAQEKNTEQDERITNLEQTKINNIYSTEEISTNEKWINGKNIYKRTIIANINNTLQRQSLGIYNVDEIIKTNIIGKDSANIQRTPYFYATNDYFLCILRVVNGEMDIYRGGQGSTYRTVTITVEYTKI